MEMIIASTALAFAVGAWVGWMFTSRSAARRERRISGMLLNALRREAGVPVGMVRDD